MAYNFIDLFAGCGGLSEGFIQTGHYRALAHVEWEKPMVDTLRNRLVQQWDHTEEDARKKVVLFDIQKTDELVNGNWTKDSIDKYGTYNHDDVVNGGLRHLVGNHHVHMIIGGPPCQAYSIHGRATSNNNMDDDYRNYLFESFCCVVDAFRPDLFVFENVAGLLSAHPGGIPVRNRIYDSFHAIGYEIRTPEELPNVLYNAYDFNVPQNRPRVIIVGIPQDSPLNLNEIYDAISNQRNLERHLNVYDAIGHLPPLYPLEHPVREGRVTRSHTLNPNPEITLHEARNHNARDRQIYMDWVNNNMNHIPHQAMVDYYLAMTGHHTLFQKYKSLEWNQPSHTIVAHLAKDGHMFIHPDANQARSITIREAACLMTFPMDYQFLGSRPYNYKMIGNAVPVRFAQGIGTGIYNCLQNHQEEIIEEL